VNRARFIVVEGVEGAGKTTQVGLLSSWMTARGIPHVTAREPGGTGVGEAIRSVLLEHREGGVPPETELLLMLGARAAFVREIVRPALARGEVVLADRFELSTFAYQGYGRGLDLEDIARLNAFATGGLTPDLTIVMDLPVSEGVSRQAREGAEPDRIEGEGVAFLDRVRRGYQELAAREGRVRMIDARGEAEVIHRRLRALLGECLPETFSVSSGS
jgi:dTMP kinase